jgi:hypothetical protein
MRANHELFTGNGYLSEAERRMKQRPLGIVSDYIVEQMPKDLAAVRRGEKHPLSLLPDYGLMPDVLEPALHDPTQRDLAGLDLKMLEAAIVHSNGIPPLALTEAVDRFAAQNDQPAVLTYEELILLNPDGDMRTFTDGKIGASETDFYRGHRYIEAHLETAIQATRAVLTMDSPGKATEALQTGAREMAEVVAYMGRFRRDFSTDDFAVFRQYVTSHPLRGLKGPSGAFTARFPELDLIVAGDSLLDIHRPYITDHLQYFPREGRQRLQEALASAADGESVVSAIAKFDNASLVEATSKLVAQLGDFRAQHYGAVGRHVPQALRGEIKGTAGSDAKQFLSGRIRATHEVNAKLVSGGSHE